MLLTGQVNALYYSLHSFVCYSYLVFSNAVRVFLQKSSIRVSQDDADNYFEHHISQLIVDMKICSSNTTPISGDGCRGPRLCLP